MAASNLAMVYTGSVIKDRSGGAFKATLRKGTDEGGLDCVDRALAISALQDAINEEMAKIMPEFLAIAAEKWTSQGKLKTVTGKQELAKKINGLLDTYSLTLLHPQTKEEVTLLAIRTLTGGSFTLESKQSKKRTCSTKDIRTLMPMSFSTPKPKAQILQPSSSV